MAIVTTCYELHLIRPYSLHDAKVKRATLNGNALELEFQNTITKLSEPYPQVEGKLIIDGIDPQYCAFFILSKNGARGSFMGKKASIRKFIQNLHDHNFEILDEHYDGNRLMLSGFWNKINDYTSIIDYTSSREAILDIGYFSGKLVYQTEE